MAGQATLAIRSIFQRWSVGLCLRVYASPVKVWLYPEEGACGRWTTQALGWATKWKFIASIW